MMARMKRAPSRLFPILAVCSALLGACESDYVELSEDLLDGGWGDPAPMLPTCVVDAGIRMDSGTAMDTGTAVDTGTSDSSNGGDAATIDSGSVDAGGSDASVTGPDAGAGNG